MSQDLTEGPVISVQLRFGYPILLANLLQTIYNLVDMVIVGQFLGANALSAVSIGSDVMLVINLGCNGLCSGAQILIAQYMGKKDDDALNRGIGTLLTTFVLLSLVLTAGLIAGTVPFLRFMNTPADSWTDTVIYTVTCFSGLLAIFGYGILGAILRGMGDSRRPLLFIGVASGINVALDLLFVGALDMGTFGAAFATVVSQTVSFLWALYYLYRRREQFGFDFRRASFRPDRDILSQFFRVGLPICLQNVLMQGATLYINRFIYAYGVAATAINGVGNRLGSVALIVTNSLVRSGASMVGQNIAAGKTDRVKSVVYFNTVVGFGFAGLLSVISILFREPIFGLFVTDPEVIAASVTYIPVLVLKYFAFASRAPSFALINGIGMPRLNLIIGLLDSLVFRVGCSLLMGIVLDMGLQGFWYGLSLGGFTPLFIGAPYFLSGRWKSVKLVTGAAGGRAEKK